MEMQTEFRIEGHTVVIDLGKVRPVLSSAPRGGGFLRTRYILNHQVSANPMCATATWPPHVWEDPARYLGRVARSLDVDRRCVAFMTAVPLEHQVLVQEYDEELWVEAFVTVGLSNAVRAGEPVPVVSLAQPHLGTINIVLVTNAALPAAAMVCALQVAVESKTAALLANQVRSWSGRSEATGTGTDALAIASGDGPFIRYSGTHTKVGSMLGRAVSQAVHEGIVRWNRWKQHDSCSALQ
jgi:adenosylcobinamide hydrolase